MNKKERRQIKQEMGYIFHDHLKLLKLSGYTLYILFPEDEGFEGNDDQHGAVVKLEYPYKQIKLFVMESTIQMFPTSKRNTQSLLLHEAIHVLLWRFAHLAQARWCDSKTMQECEEELADHIVSVLEGLAD